MNSPMTRADFSVRYGRRALFGMVHLRPLPGAPLFTMSSLERTIEAAIEDAQAIEAGGGDGLVFENFGDRPFRKKVDAETIAAMTLVITLVSREVRLPVGINVLRNDSLAALAIAAVTGADFIRVNVHAGAVLTDQGIIEGEADALLRKRAALDPDVGIFADHMVKHSIPIGPIDPLQLARDLRFRGLADALIITGRETGNPPSVAHLQEMRDTVDAPLLIGSGLTAQNAAEFAMFADGAIVGTSIKVEGRVERQVDRDRVEQLAAAFKA